MADTKKEGINTIISSIRDIITGEGEPRKEGASGASGSENAAAAEDWDAIPEAIIAPAAARESPAASSPFILTADMMAAPKKEESKASPESPDVKSFLESQGDLQDGEEQGPRVRKNREASYTSAASERLLSSKTAGHISEDLESLAKAILSQRDIGIGSSELTVEGLTRSLLRPILKEWLDRNLPHLIERIVRQEIDALINRRELLD